MEDWKLPGPRVTLEWLTAVVDGSGDLTTYHHEWVRRSGVAENSAVCHNHFLFCQALRAFVSVDQVDPTNLLGVETLVRKLVQDEVAIGRNPKHPDYGGLDVMLHAPTTEHGAAQVAAFTEWVTERMKDQANIHKQTRLWASEQRLRNSKGGQQDDSVPTRRKRKTQREQDAKGGGRGKGKDTKGKDGDTDG